MSQSRGKEHGSANGPGEAFLSALLADFEANGVAAIVKARAADPAAYIRVIASLPPREGKLDGVVDLTDEQLDACIRR